MNNQSATRLYFLFALLLAVMGWKICQDSGIRIQKMQAEQAAHIEQVLGSMDN